MNANPLDLFWEGFALDSYIETAPNSLLIKLKVTQESAPKCRRCKDATNSIHDTRVRRVRERDLLHYRVWLEVPMRRVRCAACGPTQEFISWLPDRKHLTASMISWIETLVRILPVPHIAQLLGVNWHTIKSIDHQRLKREVIEPDKMQIRKLIMDEFALFKGHRYATVAIDADTQQVLWVGEGRSRAAVRPFFEWLGPDACARIEAVAMDKNTAMDLEVQMHCPKARVVYDLFHVVAKFGREVIDRVRVDQANKLRHDKPARKVVKRSRWLFLRNRNHLKHDQAIKLEELLSANQSLMTVYVLKKQLKELWYAPSEIEAKQRWSDWLSMAISRGLSRVIRFTKRLSGYGDGIIASAAYPMSTSVLEGMNNKIKVIKRMAYRYRDNDYFFLKIKAAFPGKAR